MALMLEDVGRNESIEFHCVYFTRISNKNCWNYQSTWTLDLPMKPTRLPVPVVSKRGQRLQG